MKQMRKIIAWVLCVAMLIPAQSIQASSQSEAPAAAATPSDAGRIEGTFPLLPLEEQENVYIYWNPGNRKAGIEQEISRATDSDGMQQELEDGIPVGKDSNDGRTVEEPVRTLNKAIQKARALQRELGLEPEQVIIYSMNPMEIRANQAYFCDGKGFTISPWSERLTDSELIFDIDGGQLTLQNVTLGSWEDTGEYSAGPLVWVSSGKMQLGKKVYFRGQLTLDYQKGGDMSCSTPSDALEEEMATLSDAETEIEENRPVIELTKEFDGSGFYMLDILGDDATESVEVVRALYADDISEEEFMENFTVAEAVREEWTLSAEAQESGNVRSTQTFGLNPVLPLTRKTIIASRAVRSSVIYWNPGEAMTIDGVTCPAGQDQDWDGTFPAYPVKTWERAKALAQGGTVVCMQPITLGRNSDGVIPKQADGSYLLDGEMDHKVALSSWDKRPMPALIVPQGQQIIIRNVAFQGLQAAGSFTGTQMVLAQGGQLIMDKNISTVNAYVQVDLSKTNGTADNPIVVNREDVFFQVYFGGINRDLSWRYHDVIVAGGELLAAGEDEAGEVLEANVVLEAANRITVENGGNSQFAWELRKDTAQDDGAAAPSHRELYVEYYFDGVYLDGIRGDDANYGASCLLPVRSFEKAQEILGVEMARSVAARADAAAKGQDVSKIALPKKIYICGTVTVNDTRSWTMPVCQDYDGSDIKAEIVTHTDIPEDLSGKIHALPNVLFYVTGAAANLTLGENIVIRSISDQQKSSTVTVDKGAHLTLTGNATLTGLDNGKTPGTKTRGIHVAVGYEPYNTSAITNGFLTLPVDWTGSIGSRSVGVSARGSNTVVTMENGEIKDNFSKEAGLDGSGIAVTYGAVFNMSGGSISGNAAYYDGSGVYVSGSKSAFVMTGGTVEKNTNATYNWFNGAGVYVNNNGTFTMGTVGGDNSDCKIINNFTDTSSSNTVKGVGVYVGYSGTYVLNSGTVQGNHGAEVNRIGGEHYGIGIYAEGTFTMLDGLIDGNNVLSEYYQTKSYGGGIYIAGTAPVKITGGTISNNWVKEVGGICINRSTAEPAGATIQIRNVNIDSNRGIYGGGISINVNFASEMELSDSIIQNNHASSSSLPVPNSFTYQDSGGLRHVSGTLYCDNVTVINNKGRDAGGILSASTLYFNKGRIENNQAIYTAGGIKINANANLYDTEISGNTATDAAGVEMNGYQVIVTDCEITDNTATGNGGAVQITRGDLYINERTAGKTKIEENQAQYGGGVYQTGGNLYLDIAGKLENRASGTKAQGNNVYRGKGTAAAGFYLLNGTMQQPSPSETDSYNVYLDSGTGVSTKFFMDPKSVSFLGGKPMYLNTTDSYLTYLNPPAGNIYGTFPIDMNKEVFKIGSVVIKPANLAKVQLYRTGTAARTQETYDKTYTALTDASVNAGYSDGGIKPERTQLGGYEDSLDQALTNVVLVGQGVYLRGTASGGDDSHGGTSPTDAVSTFQRASEILEANTTAANQIPGGQGFSPFIYICGNVLVNSNETWELDSDAAMYTTNSKYVEYERDQGRVPDKAQVRRFTSFVTEPMVSVSGNGTILDVNKIIVDGMGDGVITAEQGTKSPMFVADKDTSLVLARDAYLRNNYNDFIRMYGSLILEGDISGAKPQSEVRQIEIGMGRGVQVYDGGTMEMLGDSRIVMLKAGKNTSAIRPNPQNSNVAVWLEAGAGMTMRDSSKIAYLGSEQASMTDSVGCMIGSPVNSSVNTASMVMEGSSSITGMYGAVAFMQQQGSLKMTDQAALTMNSRGIYGYMYGKGHVRVELDQDASITKNTEDGLFINNSGGWTSAQDTFTLLLKGRSKISENGSYGFKANYAFDSKLLLTLEETASISKNGVDGIYLEDPNSLEIHLKDNSWIGGHTGGAGINLINGSTNSGNKEDTYVINMSGNALIGGDGAYNSSEVRKETRRMQYSRNCRSPYQCGKMQRLHLMGMAVI